MTKQLGNEAETIFENIQRGIVTLEQVKSERDALNFLNDVNPTTKSFQVLSIKEKTLFFDWTELNKAICSFDETLPTNDMEIDNNGNIIVDEW